MVRLVLLFIAASALAPVATIVRNPLFTELMAQFFDGCTHRDNCAADFTHSCVNHAVLGAGCGLGSVLGGVLRHGDLFGNRTTADIAYTFLGTFFGAGGFLCGSPRIAVALQRDLLAAGNPSFAIFAVCSGFMACLATSRIFLILFNQICMVGKIIAARYRVAHGLAAHRALASSRYTGSNAGSGDRAEALVGIVAVGVWVGSSTIPTNAGVFLVRDSPLAAEIVIAGRPHILLVGFQAAYTLIVHCTAIRAGRRASTFYQYRVVMV